MIPNGRVMDPENLYDDIANVAVRDGRLVEITKERIEGKDTIDATGHVVAPGFIDTHNHWQRAMGYKIALRDGVTTSFDLEYGTVGSRVAEWYAERDGKTQSNYGTASSHEGARSEVLDQCPRCMTPRPHWIVGQNLRAGLTPSQNSSRGTRSSSIIDQGLADGAIGVAATLGYFR